MTDDRDIKRLLFGIELTLFAIVLGLTVGNAVLALLVGIAGLVLGLAGMGERPGPNDPDALPDVPAG